MAPSRADMEGLTVTVCKVTENLAYSFTVCHFFLRFSSSLPSSHPLAQSLHGFFATVAVAKGGETEVALAAGTKAHAGGADYRGAVEHLLEEAPALLTLGSTHPELGSVLAAIDAEAHGAQGVGHESGVAHIVVDGGSGLCLAVGGVDSFGCAL